jgi:hypothetical protein
MTNMVEIDVETGEVSVREYTEAELAHIQDLEAQLATIKAQLDQDN